MRSSVGPLETEAGGGARFRTGFVVGPVRPQGERSNSSSMMIYRPRSKTLGYPSEQLFQLHASVPHRGRWPVLHPNRDCLSLSLIVLTCHTQQYV